MFVDQEGVVDVLLDDRGLLDVFELVNIPVPNFFDLDFILLSLKVVTKKINIPLYLNAMTVVGV